MSSYSSNVGDGVKKRILIARIGPRDFEVALRNAEGIMQRSRANAQRAQADYDRILNIQRQDPAAIDQAKPYGCNLDGERGT